MTKPLLVRGMLGLGDSLHQRAIIKQLVPDWDVFLETSWPSVYHDLPIHCVRRPTRLRTQTKNAARGGFYRGVVPHAHSIRIKYNRPTGTVLQTMCENAHVSYEKADISLPIPDTWHAPSWPTSKPLMVYRPLTARPEWRGSELRNADPDAYAGLLHAIRDRYFVISVADLQANAEWLVGPPPDADVMLHAGELSFETIAALFAAADLVFTSGGFGAILAPSVGTPCVSIIGGYERSAWLASGAKFAPWLGIEPINPCTCHTSACHNRCNKRIDLPTATARLLEFVHAT